MTALAALPAIGDEQATMLVATVPILIAVLVCLPVWFWIYTVRARRKRARIEYQLWRDGVERSLKHVDFSRITVGEVTADRIIAVPTPAPAIELIALTESRSKAEGRGDA